MGGVSNDERKRLHTLDQRLRVVLAEVLTQCQTVLVDQWVIQLSLRPDCGGLTYLKVIFTNLWGGKETSGIKQASMFFPYIKLSNKTRRRNMCFIYDTVSVSSTTCCYS